MKATPELSSMSPRRYRLALFLRRIAVDAIAPIAVIKLLEAAGATPLWALVAGGFPPLVSNLLAWRKAGHLEPLGIVVIAAILIDAVTSLLSHNVTFILAKGAFLTGGFGLAALASLFLDRPLMFFLIRQTATGGDGGRVEAWDRLWTYAAFRSGTRLIAAMWGGAFALEATLRVRIVYVLSPDQVVVVGTTMGLAVTAALVVATRFAMKGIRKRVERSDSAVWPT